MEQRCLANSTGQFGHHSELTGVTRNLRLDVRLCASGGPKKARRRKGIVSLVLTDGRLWSIAIQGRRCFIAEMSTFAQSALAQ